MTTEERENIVRVCGHNFEYSDIPSYIRQRDEKEVKEYWEQGEFDEDVSVEYREGEGEN